MPITYFVGAAGAPYFATCLSSDPKPAAMPDNCTLVETDTGKSFKSSSNAWSEVVNTSFATTGQIPVIPSNITQSQVIPTGSVALMVDGTTFNNGVSITFQGTAQAIFIKQLQLV